jgi:O-6-methylguanine DNA methyltransferase
MRRWLPWLRAGEPVDGASVPLEHLLERAPSDGAVPVAVDGTSFTLAVLDALCGCRSAQRCTYAELAAAAGRPAAVRAVASVMARNRVPLVLPCHRVVPSAGGTGRYGWGDAVKVALLDAEAGAAA